MFETEEGDIYDISGFTPEERNYFFTQNPTAKELQDYSGVSLYEPEQSFTPDVDYRDGRAPVYSPEDYLSVYEKGSKAETGLPDEYISTRGKDMLDKSKGAQAGYVDKKETFKPNERNIPVRWDDGSESYIAFSELFDPFKNPDYKKGELEIYNKYADKNALFSVVETPVAVKDNTGRVVGTDYKKVYPYADEKNKIRQELAEIKQKGLKLPEGVQPWSSIEPPKEIVEDLLAKRLKAKDMLDLKLSIGDKFVAGLERGEKQAAEELLGSLETGVSEDIKKIEKQWSILELEGNNIEKNHANILARQKAGEVVDPIELERHNQRVEEFKEGRKAINSDYEDLSIEYDKLKEFEDIAFLLKKDYSLLRKGAFTSANVFGDLFVGAAQYFEAGYEMFDPYAKVMGGDISEYALERKKRVEVAREEYRPDVAFDDAFSSPENLGRFIAEETFRQLPIFAVMAATGGAGSVAGLSTRAAAAMSGTSMGVMSAGQQLNEMNYEEFLDQYDDVMKYGENLEFNDKRRSDLDKFLVATGYGAAEGLLGTAPTYILGARFFKNATKTMQKEAMGDLLTGNAANRFYATKIAKEFAIGTSSEAITEGLTQLTQNIISGNDNIWEGVDHATFSGGFFGGFLGGGSVAMGAAVRTLMPESSKTEVDALSKRLLGLQEELLNPELDNNDVARIKDDIKKTNNDIYKKIEEHEAIFRKNMSYSAFNAYKKAFAKQSELRNEAVAVQNSKASNRYKKTKINELAEQYAISQVSIEAFKQSSNKFELLKVNDEARYNKITEQAKDKLLSEGLDPNEGALNKEAYEIYLAEEVVKNNKAANAVLKSVKDKKSKGYNFETEKEATDFANKKIDDEKTSDSEKKFWRGVIEDGGALNGQASKIDGVYTYITVKESQIKNERANTGTHEVSHLVLWDWIDNGFDVDVVAKEIKNFLEETHPDIAEEMFGFVDPAQVVETVSETDDIMFNSEEIIVGFIERIGRIKKDKKVSRTFLYNLGSLFKNKANIPSDISTQPAVVKFISDMAKKINDGTFNKEDLKSVEESEMFKKLKTDAEKTTRGVKPSKSVLSDINSLVPESIKTKEDFLSRDVFNKAYESTLPGGAIYNYVNSRAISKEEAELMLEGVVDRMINYDPAAVRKTEGGEPITFGEFIFANTRFSKLDAKKKLAIEAERRAESLDVKEARQVADDSVDVPVQETVGVKERPTINPLGFTGAPENITITKEPEGSPTFKNIAKQYAGEIGEQIIGIPAKKIDEAAANLGSIVEARTIQQFFFKADNLAKFVKILPKYNIALPEAVIGKETLDVPKNIKGTALGLPKRVLDYFYEPHIDPTGKLTSPKGRSKGLTSQTNVRKLKPEFIGSISKETLEDLKTAIGITPKGVPNVLPKGELRSPIGQLLKGMAKTYSSLAANTFIRQEMRVSGFSKSEIAGAASGKRDIMKSYSTKYKTWITKVGVVVDSNPFKSKFSNIENVNRVRSSFVKNVFTPLVEDFGFSEIIDTLMPTISAGWGKVYSVPVKFEKADFENQVADEFVGYYGKNGELKPITQSFLFLSRDDWFGFLRSNGYDVKYDKTSRTYEFDDKKFKIKASPGQTANNFSDWDNTKWTLSERQDYAINQRKGFLKIANKLKEQYDKKELSKEDLTMILNWFNSSIRGLVRTAAIPSYFFKTKNLGDKDYRYEHTIPAVEILQEVARYITYDNYTRTLDEIFKNYKVAIIPKIHDRVLSDFYRSSMPGGNIFFNEEAYLEDAVYVARYADPSVVSAMDSTSNAVKTKLPEIKLQKFSESKTLTQYNKELTNKTNKLLEARKINAQQKAIAKSRSMSYHQNPKGISVYDFDDTLAFSESKVIVNQDDETYKITPAEFASNGESLLEEGATFDFSEFNKVVQGTPGPLIPRIKKAIDKFGNKNIFILTARPEASERAIHAFMKGLGLEIPIKNITGLANSTAQAKADWMVSKVAEGYNDFYFVDDAIKNVTAVKEVLETFDVKSKVQQAVASRKKSMSSDLNKMVERNKGVKAKAFYSQVIARKKGASKGKYKYFIPPSAEDFRGLTSYTLAGKGKQGEADQEFFETNLVRPYVRGVAALEQASQALKKDYKALLEMYDIRNRLGDKIADTDYTIDQAIRIYLWNKQGQTIPGVYKRSQKKISKLVENDPDLVGFAEGLQALSKKEAWVEPKEHWDIGSILKDLNDISDNINRKEYLAEFIENADEIFSKTNLNKLEAVYGTNYVKALVNSIDRMKSGSNRPGRSGDIEQRWLNWVNNSVGTIMFFNRRSALLQMLSFTNFMNWSDNNPLKAGAAFANQPAYWKAWAKIFNSDKLKERRAGLKSDIQEAEIASQAINAKDKASAVIAYLLKIGFKPTQIADSFAIATGGASFLINRTKTYKKQGMSDAQAEAKAFEDFSTISDETQQSGDPMLVSKQQASHLGRLILAFQNTPMQYTRLIKKAGQDLIAGRGDWKTNLSKIAYYGFIQNLIFASLQTALFAMLPEFNPDDDDEKRKEVLDKKYEKIINNMIDTLLRGSGLAGAVVSTLKNGILRYYKEEEKGYTADHTQTILELMNVSPPIGSKFRKIYSAIQTDRYEKDVINAMGWDVTLDGKLNPSPVYQKWASVASAALNLPLDRALVEVKGVSEALDSRNNAYQRMALGLGWRTWDVNVKNEEQDYIKIVYKRLKKEKQVEKRKAKAKAKKEAKAAGKTSYIFDGKKYEIKTKK